MNNKVDELLKTLKDVIQAYLDENEVSVAEMIGSLECLKQAYVEQAFEEDDED